MYIPKEIYHSCVRYPANRSGRKRSLIYFFVFSPAKLEPSAKSTSRTEPRDATYLAANALFFLPLSAAALSVAASAVVTHSAVHLSYHPSRPTSEAVRRRLTIIIMIIIIIIIIKNPYESIRIPLWSRRSVYIYITSVCMCVFTWVCERERFRDIYHQSPVTRDRSCDLGRIRIVSGEYRQIIYNARGLFISVKTIRFRNGVFPSHAVRMICMYIWRYISRVCGYNQ